MIKTLILTPDGVGSTFLQRTLTAVYKLAGIEVKNIHEVQTGLKFFDQHGVKKALAPKGTPQSLKEIQEILTNNRQSIIAVASIRHDNLHPLEEQKEFYKFCNEYFDEKIACYRRNVFEYALSWSIRNKSGLPNAYTLEEKKLIQTPKSVDVNFFKKKCQHYIDYLWWVDEFFTNCKSVFYEDVMKDADAVLNSLTEHKDMFTKHFDLSLNDFIKFEFEILQDLIENNDLSYLEKNKKFAKFYTMRNFFDKLEGEGTLTRKLPIKNTSLKMKQKIVSNFKECTNAYDEFLRKHNMIDGSVKNYDYWTDSKIKW